MDRVKDLIFSGNRVHVTFESGHKYVLRKKDLIDFPLHENDEIDENLFHHFVVRNHYPLALNVAVEMLARRACSRKEIADRLASRGFCGDVSSLVLSKLEKEKLLDDRDFSSQWIRYRTGSGYGTHRIYRELRMKGVDENTAREALMEAGPDEESAKAFDLAMKGARKTKPGEDIFKAHQRVLRSLVSRGFDWDTAREAVDQAFQSLEQ